MVAILPCVGINQITSCPIEQHSPWKVIPAGESLVIVDAQDFEYLSQYRWLLHKFSNKRSVLKSRAGETPADKSPPFFANIKAYFNNVERRGTQKTWLHHEVARLAGESWRMVYHLNGYTLDNRRCNLGEFLPNEQRYYPGDQRELHKLKAQRLKVASQLQALINDSQAAHLQSELKQILQILQP